MMMSREQLEKQNEEIAATFGPPLMEICHRHRARKLHKPKPIQENDCIKLNCRRDCPILYMPKALPQDDLLYTAAMMRYEFYGIDMNMYPVLETVIPDEFHPHSRD